MYDLKIETPPDFRDVIHISAGFLRHLGFAVEIANSSAYRRVKK
jgi:hypothetical protein